MLIFSCYFIVEWDIAIIAWLRIIVNLLVLKLNRQIPFFKFIDQFSLSSLDLHLLSQVHHCIHMDIQLLTLQYQYNKSFLAYFRMVHIYHKNIHIYKYLLHMVYRKFLNIQLNILDAIQFHLILLLLMIG